MDGLTPPEKFLLAPRSAWIAVPLAFAIGAAYAWYLFGTDFVLGTADFWRRPRGNMGGRLDMASVLSAYDWFVADDWRWPLLSIPRASWPEGANAFALDVAPLVAILGKLIRTLTGQHINLYPLWHVLTFALPAALLTAAVRGMGQRSLAAALLGGAMGALSPMVHLRFGHAAQLAHWLPVAALALYFSANRRWRLPGLLGLALLAAMVNLYLFVMVAAVAGAAFLQEWADGRISITHFLVLALALPVAGFLPVWSFGLLGMPNLTTGEIEFGSFSMNILSLFWPQTSGALQWTGIPLLTGEALDGTGGQYEGYAYLGLGALLLLVGSLWLNRRRLWPALRHHWALALVCLVLVAWALSNEIYIGTFMLLWFPLPQFLLDTILAWFRSAGRFIWPVAWLLVALGIAGIFSARRRTILVLLCLAIGLQWADLSVWRGRIAVLVAAAQPSAFGDNAVAAHLEREIAARGLVTIIPPFFCSSSGGNYEGIHNIAASETQLMAARGNAHMRWTLTARGKPDCAGAATTALPLLMADGVLIVLADKETVDRTDEARGKMDCRDFALGVVCAGPK